MKNSIVKKIILIAVCAAILLLAFSCTGKDDIETGVIDSNGKEFTADVQTAEKTDETKTDAVENTAVPDSQDDGEIDFLFPTTVSEGGISAEVAGCGETMSEMYNQSANVIVGTVVEHGTTDPKYFKTSVYANVRVERVLKGGLSEDDTVRVADVGEFSDDGSEISVDGVPLLRRGMRVLLFLTDGHSYTVSDEGETMSYSIMGGEAGKFFIDENGLCHNVQEFTKAHTYVMSDSSPARTVDELLNFN